MGTAAQNAGNAQGASIQGAGNALSTFANSAPVQNAFNNLFGSNAYSGTNLPGTSDYNPNLTAGGYRAPDNSFL